ncbi:hypothetical protein H5410_019619 [Solanum commersonii]|uniref:Uncharacterized protein n=1 Tax=Solanum commersonii TaxID=4109 RepID=A0A9J5Z6S8_SOLCO|nr:hypothetical protein H5410_019619 [Solanum commersonii]
MSDLCDRQDEVGENEMFRKCEEEMHICFGEERINQNSKIKSQKLIQTGLILDPPIFSILCISESHIRPS